MLIVGKVECMWRPGVHGKIFVPSIQFCCEPNTALKLVYLKGEKKEYSSGPVVRTQCFHCQALGLIPSRGTEIPQAAPQAKKKKKKQATTITELPYRNIFLVEGRSTFPVLVGLFKEGSSEYISVCHF